VESQYIAKVAGQAFADELFTTLAQVLAKDTGACWKCSARSVDARSSGSDQLNILVNFEGDMSGSLLLELPNEDAVALATTLLGQSKENVGEIESSAIVKLVSRGVSEFCSGLVDKQGEVRGRCSLDPESASKSPDDWASPIGVSFSDESSKQVSLSIRFSKGLAELFDRQSDERRDATQIGNGSGDSNGEPVNLELVLDVELNVTLRFGRRKLTLREVLELTSGSVIELDRQVEEPVELLLDGKVIARGEAVVIDGNYGLRVTEVPHNATLATL
jgi:flagellar motor switch protein FliN/FliY